jgi:hypothetical protein
MLVPIEIEVLQALKQGHDKGVYWDTLSRCGSMVPDFEVVIQNIKTKAERSGIVPTLLAIRFKYFKQEKAA